MKYKKYVRRVDFVSNKQDLKCVLLASFGLSTKYIEKVTGLTANQIHYRLALADTKRSDYRNGNSQVAKFVLSQTERDVVEQIKGKLR